MSITHYQDQIKNQDQAKTFINKQVNVNSVYFSGRNNFRSFPREISYDNHQVTFVESGMRYLLQKGQKVVQLFDMSDGQSNYRLQFDSSDFTWTLLNISSLPR